MFEISLDKLLKEDKQMIRAMDKERLYGTYVKREKSIIDFLPNVAVKPLALAMGI